MNELHLVLPGKWAWPVQASNQRSGNIQSSGELPALGPSRESPLITNSGRPVAAEVTECEEGGLRLTFYVGQWVGSVQPEARKWVSVPSIIGGPLWGDTWEKAAAHTGSQVCAPFQLTTDPSDTHQINWYSK